MLFPVIILSVAAAVLIVAYAAVRRSKEAGEHPAVEDDASRLATEREFEAAEAYQEKWREEQHREHPPESLY